MSDINTMKLRTPVALKKGADEVLELTLKPTGRALRGVQLPFGVKNDRVFQRFGVFALACAALRMAGVDSAYAKTVANALNALDLFELHARVKGMLLTGDEEGTEPRVKVDEKAGTVTITLRREVQFGKTQEPVKEFVLRADGAALRDLEYIVSAEAEDGLSLMHADVWDLALVGVRMGRVTGDSAIVDMMDPGDVVEVAQAVLGFIQGGPSAGSETSPS